MDKQCKVMNINATKGTEFYKYCETLFKRNVSECYLNEFIMMIGEDLKALKKMNI